MLTDLPREMLVHIRSSYTLTKTHIIVQIVMIDRVVNETV